MKNAKLVPKIRFGEFLKEWERKPLNHFLSVLKTKNKAGKFKRDQVLSVAAEAGVVNQIEYHGRSYAGKSLLPYNVVEVGDLVYTKSPLKAYPYGIIKKNSTKAGVVSTLYAVYRPKNTAAATFIDYYFYLPSNANRYLKPLVNIGAKNDMKVNNATVLTGKVVFPPLPEQQKIATFLSLIDQRISASKLKVYILGKWKNSISNRLFTEISHCDKCKLGTKSKTFSGGTPESTRRYLYDGNIPFIKSGEISQMTTKSKISEEALKLSSAKMVKKGDLLYALYGATSGETAISKMSGAINQAVLCIRSDYDTQFLYHFLHYNKEKIITKYLQGGQGNLSAKIVKSIKIPILENPEQIRIARILTSIDARISAAEREVAGWETWKKGLLQKMLV